MRFILLLTCITTLTNAQNLVSNHSFEKLNAPAPKCDFSSGPEFINIRVKNWQTFKIITPDIIFRDTSANTNCILPKPHKGTHMLGLIMYHPFYDAQFSFDYHEFIQGSLAKPMEKGKTYRVSFWTYTDDSLGAQHLYYVFKKQVKTRPVMCNNFGFYFTEAPINPNEQFNESIATFDIRPQINVTEIVRPNKGQWQKISLTFTADKAYRYFVFGNFFSDAVTDIDLSLEEREQIDLYNQRTDIDFWKKKKRIAYYLFDDFSIIEESALAALERTIKEEKKYVIPDKLLFETGKSALQPAAYPVLNDLAQVLVKNPALQMEIAGHTDADGADEANQQLSEARAKAVYQYLIDHKASTSQLTWRGYGESRPTADNTTPEGKQKNRRVECRVKE